MVYLKLCWMSQSTNNTKEGGVCAIALSPSEHVRCFEKILTCYILKNEEAL